MSGGTRPQPEDFANGPIPDELIDAMFDRELSPADQERLFKTLRRDLKRCEEVARTRRMLAMLREQPECPDFATRILGEVRARRGFLPQSLRRMVTGGRVAVAASLLLGVLTIALIERRWPGTTALTPEPRPVTDVIQAGGEDARTSMRQFASAVDELRGRVDEPTVAVREAIVAQPRTPQPVGADELSGTPRPSWLTLSPGRLTAVREPTIVRGRSTIVIESGSGAVVAYVLPPAPAAEPAAPSALFPLGQQTPFTRAETFGWGRSLNPFVLPATQPPASFLTGVVRAAPPQPRAPSPLIDR